MELVNINRPHIHTTYKCAMVGCNIFLGTYTQYLCTCIMTNSKAHVYTTQAMQLTPAS